MCVPNGGRWEVGPTPIDLSHLGHQLFGGPSTLVYKYPFSFYPVLIIPQTIQQMHRDHVPTLPPNFHLLASTLISPNQGMVRYSDHRIQILTVQGHPEFNESIVTSIIEQRAASGVIDAQAAEDAERRRLWDTDGGPRVGNVIWKVILGEI